MTAAKKAAAAKADPADAVEAATSPAPVNPWDLSYALGTKPPVPTTGPVAVPKLGYVGVKAPRADQP